MLLAEIIAISFYAFDTVPLLLFSKKGECCENLGSRHSQLILLSLTFDFFQSATLTLSHDGQGHLFIFLSQFRCLEVR